MTIAVNSKKHIWSTFFYRNMQHYLQIKNEKNQRENLAELIKIAELFNKREEKKIVALIKSST